MVDVQRATRSPAVFKTQKINKQEAIERFNKINFMELIGLLILAIPLCFPILGGLCAISFGRNFWVWFFISFFLPFVSCFIIVCLPNKRKKQTAGMARVVENEELYDHLFDERNSKIQRA